MHFQIIIELTVRYKIFHLYFEQDIQLERKYPYEGAGLFKFIMLRYM